MKRTRTRKPTRTPKRRQPIAFTLAALGDSTRGMVIAMLQLQDGPLPVTDETSAKLWGAAIGQPFYLRMDDHHSQN